MVVVSLGNYSCSAMNGGETKMIIVVLHLKGSARCALSIRVEFTSTSMNNLVSIFNLIMFIIRILSLDLVSLFS